MGVQWRKENPNPRVHRSSRKLGEPCFPLERVDPRVGIFLSPLDTHDGFYLSSNSDISFKLLKCPLFLSGPCGANSNCKLYHTECVNGQCGCKTDCSQAEYHPVCGHPHDLPDQAKVFGSLCEMQRYGCENDKIYVVSHTPGACSKVEKTGKAL